MPHFRLGLTAVLLLATVFPGPTTPVLAQTELDDRMYDIARELWCPLCSGIRLDACELQACVQMRAEIRELLAEGRDPEWIIAYFEEEYGPQIHGQPPLRGFQSLAWLVPAVAVVGLGIGAGLRTRRAVRQRRSAVVPRIRSQSLPRA
jgi:cytochrome c-type biogenesis protein CcmH